MIRSSLAPLGALAALTAIAASPASAQSVCGPREHLVKLLADHYKEDPVGMGLSQPGQILEVFASSNGSWTMVMTMPDGKACMIAAGDSWEMVIKVKGNPV
ncbi:hypothetical protein [Microvirga terrestris]|uniref:Uncharacterized protein n=1 Tax=Microvirga terrestris TaxID=2791024 RepID=A0ABS0HVT7_9HYPH|nr:hypothetical protein [Microvirga terrestris]MBF9197614.1 hypothetical protein [Microvirga terrestris]